MGRVQSVSCSLTSQPWGSLGSGDGRRALCFSLTCRNEKTLPPDSGPLVVHITGSACDIFTHQLNFFRGVG